LRHVGGVLLKGKRTLKWVVGSVLANGLTQKQLDFVLFMILNGTNRS